MKYVNQMSDALKRGICLIVILALSVTYLPMNSVVNAEGSTFSFGDDTKEDTLVDQGSSDHYWDIAGSNFPGATWDETQAPRMKHLVGGFYQYSTIVPAGTMEFKFRKNGVWDNAYDIGPAEGGNFQITLANDSKVNFYIKEWPDGTNDCRFYVPGLTSAEIDAIEATGLRYYNPADSYNLSKWPRLVGSIQSAFGESEWSPGTAQQYFVDYNFDGTVYKLQRDIVAGSYAAKVVFGDTWADQNYGSSTGDLTLDTSIDTKIIFSIDLTKENPTLKHNYVSFGDINEADTLISQSGALNSWEIAGALKVGGTELGWNSDNDIAKMTHVGANFFAYSAIFDAGTDMEFKFKQNGKWDVSIGPSAGGNFKLTLSQKTKVNFYLKEDSNGNVSDYRIYIPGLSDDEIKNITDQGLQFYDPSGSISTWPRLVGNIQTYFDEGSWSPANARQYFIDYNFDGTVYKLQREISAGNYEAKVVLGNGWDKINYGTNGVDGSNLGLKILDNQASVLFTLDLTDISNQTFGHNYVPSDSQFDGKINTSKLYFDSRSITYKKPFGAVREESEDATFRIAAEQGDVEFARLELTDGQGLSKTYDMYVATVVDGKDYFEVTVDKSEFVGIGIWSYKFILIDGTKKYEYGDDNLSGGTGAVSEDGQVGYNLTVYAKDYTTPDWMKNAVVYQIFPDRFFDGNSNNNRAKTIDGYRGIVDKDGKIFRYPIQYFDGGVTNDPTPDQVWGNWNSYPENPRHLDQEQAYNYPDSRTDGQWSNEFYGGDIKGIEQKLSYLQSIGVTAIYLNPVSWAASNHKYDATDYQHLDPMFGEPVYNTPGDPKSGLNYEATRIASDAVYIAFANAASQLGIHLISDGVFNHVGDDSIYFDRYEKYPEIGAYEYWKRVWDKVNENGMSKDDAITEVISEYTALINPATGTNYSYPNDFRYTTWFEVGPDKTVEGVYKYDAWWGFDSLPAMAAMEPQDGDTLALSGQHEYNNVTYREEVIGFDLNTLAPDKADEMIQKSNSQRWLWMGASGWRLDVAPDVSTGTWQEFRKAVKSATGKTDANGNAIADPVIIGEEWGVATHYLLGDQFDSVMNYQFRGAIQNFLMNGNAAEFDRALETIRENYPKEAFEAMLNLVGSHDTVRNLTKLDNPTWEEENIKIAPEGTEEGLKLQALTAIFQYGYPGAPTVYYGDEVGVTGTKDPDSRRTFPWDRIVESNGSFSATGDYEKLFKTYQQAGKVRNEYLDVFATGQMKTAFAADDTIAYARKSDTKGGILAINRSDTAKTIIADVSGFLPNGLVMTDRLGLFTVASSVVTDGKLTITLPAYAGVMMISDNDIVNVASVNNLAAVGGNGVVDLTFDSVDGVSQYNIYRTTLEGINLEKIDTVSSNAYSDTTVKNGVRYYYYVSAIKDGNESLFSEVATALPAFVITNISSPSAISVVTIGVGVKTEPIEVTVTVPGLTDDANFTGKDVPNLVAKLVYNKTGDTVNVKEAKLRYKEDNSDSKVYTATFEPVEVGTYEYYAKISVNNGYSYTNSQSQSVTTQADPNGDGITLNKPVLKDILVESNRATLEWTIDTESKAVGFEVYRTYNGEKKRVATLASNVKNYTDFTVSNDKLYSYEIAVFDKYYNRTISDPKSVTPKLVMVDVTLRLHIPSYTPVTDNIYLAGSTNGWNSSGNKLNVPSGATTRDVVEYSFKMMAGKSMEYKYTRGTWETEAFSSHDRKQNDTEDPGNWAYSSTDTNMKLTIKNQGGNKMIVDDYVLRWVDMPMMITLPRASYTSDDVIEYTTGDSTYTLKGYVPYGVKFTIDGVDINTIKSGAMDQYGNIYTEGLPLKYGLNEITLHMEPTAETLALGWYTDKGRAKQATATLKMYITRTGSAPSTGSTTQPTTETPTTPESKLEEVKNILPKGVDAVINDSGKIVVKIESAGVVDFDNKEIQAQLQIAADNVQVKNLNLKSDLVLTGKNATIANSVISGKVSVKPVSGETLTIKGTTMGQLVIEKPKTALKEAIKLVISGATKISKFYIDTAVSVEMSATKSSANTTTSNTPVIENTYVSVPAKTTVSLKGQFKKVTFSSKQADVKLLSGTINELIVKDTAINSTLTLSKNTKVTKYTLSKGVVISGKNTSKMTVKVVATSLDLSYVERDLKAGKTVTLKPIVTPKIAVDTFTFKTSNKNVATVSKTGVVTGIKKGKAVITITSSTGKTVKCTINVK